MKNSNDKVANIDLTEYKYHMFSRPFGIGTYPNDNFLRWEDDNTRYGVLVYSKPVPIADFSHYSLVPITEAEMLDGKTIYLKDIPISLKVIVNHRGVYIFELTFTVGEEEHKDCNSIENVMRYLEEGNYSYSNS